MKKIAYDSMKFDALKIVDDKKGYMKVNAVITKEGVYPYPDGRAFKSKRELLKATRTARNAKITIMDHPDSMVIMSQSQIYGVVESPFFERDKIRAILSFDKQLCPPQFLVDVRNGKAKDVSIGFYYAPDFTPGTWNGQPYDYVMRDIVIDHVAAGVLKGRCSYPSCGIGVDALMRRIALDPFAGYKDFADCVAKNQDKKDPTGYCATIKREVEGTSQSPKGGKKTMSENESGQTTPSEFEACVSQRMSEGYTRGEAETYCLAYTKHEDEPSPVDQPTPEDPSSSTGGAQEQHAPTEPEGPKETEDLFAKCVRERMAEGSTREEAEKVCRTQEPVGDQEVEKTELERCIENQVEQGKSPEEAKEWCLAEQSGEHAPAADMIDKSQKLLRMREQRNIELNRERRRNPL